MQTNDKIVCVVGESGAGKTLLVEAMKLHGYREVECYTTRSKRKGKSDNKTFVNRKQFNKVRPDLVAYTEFSGHEYGATRQQVEEAHLYIIDPDGINELAAKYGKENIIVVCLRVNEDERFNRLLEDRGWSEAIERINNDREKFNALYENRMSYAHIDTYVNDDLDDYQDNVRSLLDLLRRVFPQREE